MSHQSNIRTDSAYLTYLPPVAPAMSTKHSLSTITASSNPFRSANIPCCALPDVTVQAERNQSSQFRWDDLKPGKDNTDDEFRYAHVAQEQARLRRNRVSCCFRDAGSTTADRYSFGLAIAAKEPCSAPYGVSDVKIADNPYSGRGGTA